ncbi:protein CASC3-like [Glandiceps talaboti]
MAERRRRRRLSESEDGSDNESVSSNCSHDRADRSDCESETGYERTGKGDDEDENSEYESAEESQKGEKVYSDEEADSDGQDNVKEERTRGDGQEEKKVDCDADQQNPQYIPRRGPYFEHDVRYTDEKDDRTTRPKSKKKLWKEEEKWAHDMYREEEQAPKSRDEIVMIYGFDVRSGEAGQRYPRPYRGRGSRGPRGGRRSQYRDRRDIYNEKNFNQYRDDNNKPSRNEDSYEENKHERQYRSPRNSYQYERRNDNHHGNQQSNSRYHSQHSEQQYKDTRGGNEQQQQQQHGQPYIDKHNTQYVRTREWTNTNYRKHQQEQISHDLEERNARNTNYPRTSNTARGREVKSYSKDRRRQTPSRASGDHEDLTQQIASRIQQSSTGLEGQVEKLTIKVEAAHGKGDGAITRTISNEKAVSPVSSNVRQQVRQERPMPSKPSPAQQRGRPKRYSSQRQRQMPDPTPPPAMHPPPLMEGPGFYDPGFQGPVYHPSTTPPTRMDGTPPPPQGPPPGPPQGPPPPPHTGQPPPPPSIRQGIMVQPDISLHPGIQHPSQPHIPSTNIYTHASMPTHPPPRAPPPPPQAGTYAPTFVSPGVVNYNVPPGPPYQLAAPVAVPVSASIPASIPTAGPPAPTPAPVPIQQYPVTSQPQGQMYGGVTYYSTEQQQLSLKRTPPRRPINPIRIEPPPEPQSDQEEQDEQQMLPQQAESDQDMQQENNVVTQHGNEGTWREDSGEWQQGDDTEPDQPDTIVSEESQLSEQITDVVSSPQEQMDVCVQDAPQKETEEEAIVIEQIKGESQTDCEPESTNQENGDDSQSVELKDEELKET